MTDPVDLDRLLNDASRHYLGDPAEALRLAEQVLAALRPQADAALRARALMVRGYALVFSSAFEDGLQALQQALALAPTEALALRIDLLRAHAIAYERMDAFDLSLDWAVQAAALARELGEPLRLADALLSIGVVRGRHGDIESGMGHALEALAIYRSHDDLGGQIQALNNIGIACKNLGRHEEALTHLGQAVEIARQLGRAGEWAAAASNLPEPLWKLGRMAQARAAAVEAVQRLTATGNLPGQTHARLLLGQLLLAEGETGPAETELQQALEIAQRTGSRHWLARTHQALAEFHKAAGAWQQALTHHEAFHAAERAQFDESAQRKLRALQVHFDLDRARNEAKLARLESERLAAQTRTDGLTGLANRRRLDEALADEWQRAQRLGHGLAVALGDIDDFKRVNDDLGHAAGDQVLRLVAQLLRRECRAIDLVARYGGEEFCIVFVEASGAEALRACEAMRQAIASHHWGVLHAGLEVTLSIGLADNRHAASPDALLAKADARLYQAKRAGKDCVISD